MDFTLSGWNEITIDGQVYPHDVVVSQGQVAKRRKKPSKRYKHLFGHTPVSLDEDIPWQGRRLVIGTGHQGSLPVMTEVLDEAKRRGVELVVLPTRKACDLLGSMEAAEIAAILHTTC